MKQIYKYFICFALLLGLFACGSGGSTSDSQTSVTPTPVELYGELSLSIDTLKADCNDNKCKDLSIMIVTDKNKDALKITVPESAIYNIHTVTHKLPVGNYILQPSILINNNISYLQSANFTITNESTTISLVKYNQSTKIGSLNISIPNLISDITSPIDVQLINYKSNNAIIESFTINQGDSYIINNLPVNDNSHGYRIIAKGIADPISADYYNYNNLAEVIVQNNQIVNYPISYKKNSSNFNLVEFKITGLINSDSATLSFIDNSNKYIYKSYNISSNQNIIAHFESGSNIIPIAL